MLPGCLLLEQHASCGTACIRNRVTAARGEQAVLINGAIAVRPTLSRTQDRAVPLLAGDVVSFIAGSQSETQPVHPCCSTHKEQGVEGQCNRKSVPYH